MDNNMMNLNTEESQKEKEKEEKKQEFKNKWKRWKEKLAEDKEDRKRAKEEEERVKAQEQAMQNTTHKEFTVTNETIKKGMNNEPTPREIKQKKEKKKKLIRNIMTIPEIIVIILIAIFLKNRYTSYSKEVHQTLNYNADNYVYEIHRDTDKIKVEKNKRVACETQPCNMENLGGYEITFEKNQMKLLRIFMDFKFFFKSDTKTITINDIKTDFGKRCLYSMIHNNNQFLEFKQFKDYTLIDYEQMSKYTTRGYKYEKVGEKRYLYIAMGEREKSGYGMVVNSVYQRGDDLYFYITEQIPTNTENSFSLVTHPALQIELTEKPKEIYVYNVITGEAYPNYDAPEVEMPTTENKDQTNVSGGLNDLIGSLRDAIKKD